MKKTINFVLGSVLSKISEGNKCSKQYIFVSQTNFTYLLLNFFCSKGYILSFRIMPRNQNKYQVFLKYNKGKKLINGFKIISKPSKRLYCTVNDLKKSFFYRGFYIVSTPYGLKTSTECLFYNVGGEVLCKIF